MVKGMRQADGLVLCGFPAGMETADVIADVSGKEAMFPALDFLFKTLAVVRKYRLFTGEHLSTGGWGQDGKGEVQRPSPVLSPGALHGFTPPDRVTQGSVSS